MDADRRFAASCAVVKMLMEHPWAAITTAVERARGRRRISLPARVLHLQDHQQRGKAGSIVFLEIPRALRRKTLQNVRKVLGRSAAQLRPKSHLALLRDADFVHDLHQLWPTLS